MDCKKIFLRNLETFLTPLQQRRAVLDANPARVDEILAHGNERARAFACQTMHLVREKMGL